jgi:hypothetical protein
MTHAKQEATDITHESVRHPMSPRIFQRQANDRAVREHLFDMAFERYVEWRELSAAVGKAYETWSNGTSADGAMSFAAYGAALDQEECAARLYGSIIDQLRRLIDAERELVAADPGARR